jgi:aspartokinase-like uncharacterized kinase
MVAAPIVVKVGGSLFDWPELRPRLLGFLDKLPINRMLVVPGGGPTANAIRHLDRLHALGEEASHWLALRAMALNAHFLAELLAPAQIVQDPAACSPAWRQGRRAILDGHAFARAEERDHPADVLPHCWAVTSDSLAARAAVVAGAMQLVLLKSVTVPPATTWAEAARRGWVDPAFPKLVAQARGGFNVQAVNLRDWNP